METLKTAQLVKNTGNEKLLQEITNFYDEATVDYAFWSKNLNMHYGYLKNPLHFFKREKMLEQMNLEVFNRLKLQNDATVVDSGCGTGATARALVRHNPTANVIGLNIVESHLEMGKELNKGHISGNRINLVHSDFHSTPLENSVADGVYAMESACHSHNKAQWIAEMKRILKPGARLVITDCFLRNPAKPMRNSSRWAYNLFRKCWSVPHLAEIKLFETMLSDEGFDEIAIEDIRWKVAPSVLHSPLIVLRFLLSNLFKGKKTNSNSAKNLKAVLLSILIGMDTRSFSYYLVTARKKD
jgi:MPBQ/MSBQ methyltransferase